jgi:hypothetical protein
MLTDRRARARGGARVFSDGPLDLPLATQGIRNAVKAIADHPLDASDAGREKCLRELIRNSFCHDDVLSSVAGESVMSSADALSCGQFLG